MEAMLLNIWQCLSINYLIEEVTEVQLLGVKIQNSLLWMAHITDLSK